MWHAWSALASHLGNIGRLDQALAVAKQAVERSPHLPRVWLDLATVHRWRNETMDEIAAAEQAFEMSPAWSRGAIALADPHERQGRLEQAARVYERALHHAPHDPHLHAVHAFLLWRQRRNDEAFAAVEHALRLAPGYEWAWELLSSWAAQSGQAGRTAEFARSLTEDRPGEMRAWLMLARVLDHPSAREERLVAVGRALELDPRSTEAWDSKAELLATAERFEDAIRGCTGGVAMCAGVTRGSRPSGIASSRRCG